MDSLIGLCAVPEQNLSVHFAVAAFAGLQNMISRIELITLHIADLLELLEARTDCGGTLSLMPGDDAEIEVDLDDLCLTVKIEADLPRSLPDHPQIIPITPK